MSATSPAEATRPAAPQPATRLSVVKGHGTHNDFVLVDDRAGRLDLDAGLVARLADRRGGVGGDGVIRLVASAMLPEGRDLQAGEPAARWFMDYRNADGSVAQMCGNGVRVLAAFCERLGLWDGTGELALGTRAGVRRVRRVPAPDGSSAPWYAVGMGMVSLPGGEAAVDEGGDLQVRVDGLDVPRPALSVDVGNPHAVVALSDEATLARAELVHAPVVRPTPVDGVNVELVVPLGEQLVDGETVGRVRMRVHERGVGETSSCGTGAVAVAAAVRSWAGPSAPTTWLVQVPGGMVRVRLAADGTAELAGPAVLVADVQVDLDALG
ncbi:diaminopimelate epimerase [Cellulomonas citrea]|uniref:diaminopimelate epimerase n=1 Tax=Cellulomonas citrea TaxID=1909423 RepID=UPI00135686D5|nr:diaminopimelate epimerase [Cellulomonas citrea]